MSDVTYMIGISTDGRVAVSLDGENHTTLSRSNALALGAALVATVEALNALATEPAPEAEPPGFFSPRKSARTTL
jgi:hypothetical protein